jgi:predicted Zn-dependent protease
MTKRILVWLLILLLALPLNAQAEFTMEEERKLGEEAFREVKKQIPLVKDPDCLNYLRKLGSMMEQKLDDHRFKFKFYLADQGEVNAFALPDAYIFMFRGLITIMESEGELAAVIAHEMSHVHFRHIASRIEKQAKLGGLAMAGLLTGLVLGAVAGSAALSQAASFGTVAGVTQASLAYSRDDEMQADFQGYKLLTSLGYDPEQMAITFNRLWRMERTHYGSAPAYLLSHPTSSSRMEFVRNMVRKNKTRITRTDNSEFNRIKTRLIALYRNEDSAEQYFKNMIRARNDLANGLYGLALIKMRMGRYQTALNALKRITGPAAEQAWFKRDMGVCYLGLGKNEKAQDLLNQALALDPSDQMTLLSLGQSLTRQNRLDEAAFTLKRLLSMNDELPQAHYDLGVALGKMGRTGEASLHLGLAFKGQNNLKMARYHLDRAVRSLEGNPELKAQAQKILTKMDEAEEEKDKKPEKKKPS